MKIRLPIRKPAPPAKRPQKLKLKATVASRRRAVAPLIVEEDEENEFLEEPEPNMKLSHAFVVVLVLHVIAVAGVFAFNSIKARQSDKVFSGSADAVPAAPAASAPEAAGTEPASQPLNAIAANPATPAAPTAPAPTTPAAATTAPKPLAVPATNAKTHDLQPGETLTKIATQFGVTVSALQEANGITDPTKIRAGTTLVIPDAPKTAITPTTANPAPAPIAANPPVAPTAAAPSKVRDSGETYVVAKGDNPVKIAKKLKVPYADLMAINGNPDPRKLQIGQKLKVPSKN